MEWSKLNPTVADLIFFCHVRVMALIIYTTVTCFTNFDYHRSFTNDGYMPYSSLKSISLLCITTSQCKHFNRSVRPVSMEGEGGEVGLSFQGG